MAGQGAHQISAAAGIDGAAGKAKWDALTPEQRFNMVNEFLDDMQNNRRIAQDASFRSSQIGSGNDPQYGGNLAQEVLNPRNRQNNIGKC